jgi:hypothetical protein
VLGDGSRIGEPLHAISVEIGLNKLNYLRPSILEEARIEGDEACACPTMFIRVIFAAFDKQYIVKFIENKLVLSICF